jgi:hypothetical protein
MFSLGIKICDHCNVAYSEHYQLSLCPHQDRLNLAEAQDDEIKRLFHQMWSRDVGTAGYSKSDWLALQRLLQSRGIEV